MWEIYSFSWQWLLYGMWFFVAFAASFFLPGLVLVSYSKLAKSLQFVIAPVLGLSLWAIQGYVLGFLQIRELTVLYICLFMVLGYVRRKKIFPLRWRPSVSKTILIISVVGIILQLVPVWGSGWRSEQGISYYFVNIFDGIFYQSLNRAIVDSMPPNQPGAVGMPVSNYHYLSNVAFAELGRVWLLPLNHVYFHYMPIVMSMWMALTIVTILKQWTTDDWSVAIGLSMYYFVGEITWILDIILGRNSPVPFEVFIDNGVLQFVNPPQTFAKLVFFSTLLLWRHFWNRRDMVATVLLAVMTASLVGFKVYFGLASGIGLAAVVFGFSAKKIVAYARNSEGLQFTALLQKSVPFMVLVVVTCGIGAALYFPTNASAGGLFFDLLTWPKLLLGVTKLNWNEWWLRLQVYQAAQNGRALAVWYSLAAAIFLAAIYHVRLIGALVVLPKLRQKLSEPELWFLLTPAIVFTLIGMNFLQTSGGSNSFNFMVVALAILNLLTALVFGSLARKRIEKFAVIALLLITAIQTVSLQGNYLRNYYRKMDAKTFTVAEQDAFAYLSTLPKNQTILQTHPTNYLDKTTPFLYFFTGHPTYLGGKGILESHNQNIADRVRDVDLLFSDSATIAAQRAHKLDISHIILRRSEFWDQLFIDQAIAATDSALPGWKVAFDSSELVIVEPTFPEGWQLDEAILE